METTQFEAATPAAVRHLPTREGYDRWAEVYDAEDNPLAALEAPVLRRLLGDVAGRTLADIGCGTGRHAIALADAGAQVEAVDFSAAMLSRARAKAAGPPPRAVRFHVHDLAAPLPFPAGSFDRVLCALVLDHIGTPAALLRELVRVCRPDGWVVATVMHPALMLRGVQARFRDPQSNEEVRPESFPHQVCDYVMAALATGWRLDALEEHAVGPALAGRMPRAEKYLGWPLLLAFRLAGPAAPLTGPPPGAAGGWG